jgi:hypothetical protein
MTFTEYCDEALLDALFGKPSSFGALASAPGTTSDRSGALRLPR